MTQGQALELSSVLYRDYQAGGASVVASVVYQPGTDVGITGQIDFRNHEGHLTVTTIIAGTGTSVEEVDYTSSEVFEQGGPVVAEELRKSGTPSEVWVGRPADPTDRPLDKIIEIMVSLASPARDNPLLIQESDARYVGNDDVNGQITHDYRYNAAVSYYVNPTTGTLTQFVGSVQGFSSLVTIDFAEPGLRLLPPPAPNTVLNIANTG